MLSSLNRQIQRAMASLQRRRPAHSVPSLRCADRHDRGKGGVGRTAAPKLTLLTASNGPLACSLALQLKVAIFSDGTCLVNDKARTNEEVLTLILRARQNPTFRLKMKPVEYVDTNRLQAVAAEYDVSAGVAETSTALRGRLTDLIHRAIHARANDIEINQIDDVATVRFQVHGYLTDVVEEFHGKESTGIFTTLFNLRDHGDGVELPHKDQKFSVVSPEKIPEAIMGIRVQTLPTPKGRALQARLNYLANSFATDGLRSLDLTPRQLKALYYIQSVPAGIISFTGPTESGKSATFNIWLSDLIDARHGGIKVFAADDPPEGIDPRIINYDVRSLDTGDEDPFYKALQIGLRLSPHFIKVGEIRSEASASLAYYAANTGKPVGCSVHCDCILDVPSRYEELGMHHRLAYHPTRHTAWIGQRLIPCICDECSPELGEVAENDERRAALFSAFEDALGSDVASKLKVRGAGCPACTPVGSITPPGIIGRRLAAEVLLPTPKFMSLLESRPAEARKTWIADQHGLSLRLRAYDYLRQGLIGAEEYTRFVTPAAGLQEDLEYSSGRCTDH